MLRTPRSTLFPYTTLFRSYSRRARNGDLMTHRQALNFSAAPAAAAAAAAASVTAITVVVACIALAICTTRSEEHTSELQSQSNLVCRLLLEKKKNKYILCD